MKRTIFLWLLGFQTISAFAQPKIADSLKALLQHEQQDTNRVLLLAKIGTSYLFEKPESGFTYAEQGLDLARTIDYKRGEAACLNALGHLNRVSGNFIAGIKYHMQALQICDTINDQTGVAESYFGIAGNYEDEQDYREALQYYYKIKPIVEALNNTEYMGGLELSMGLCFLRLGLLDSALKYEQNAYELQMNSQGKSLALGRLGSVHTAMNNYDVALGFYRMGIPIAISTSDNNALTELYSGVFSLFQKRQMYDSCIYYGKKELETADKSGSPAAIAVACSDLFESYKKMNARDSALKYLELAAITKDTLITQEKIKQEQLLSFQEESRQHEKQAEVKASAEKRKKDIQFAAIAIGVIAIILLFFLLSRSIIINAYWIRFLGVLSLLVSFDFLNLVLHPYLSEYANDSPILMLCALVILSAILIPLHHKIERWVIEKMVEKNKAIRLAAARKTIEKLEKHPANG